jgi:hypothetical protein
MNAQPNKFFAPGLPNLGIAASNAVADGWEWFQTRMATRRVSLALMLAAIKAYEIVRQITPGCHGRYDNRPGYS